MNKVSKEANFCIGLTIFKSVDPKNFGGGEYLQNKKVVL